MKHGEPGLGLNALDLAEQAVDLLRRRATVALADYYLGTLPFILGLLYFWSDMSRNPYADWYCAPAAAGVALLFIWMKVWQVRYCRRLWCALNDMPMDAQPKGQVGAIVARQSLIQASAMVVLPLAALIVLPLAWAYAFYQNALIVEGTESRGLKELYREALAQTWLWPGQNHLLLTIFSGLALFILINVVMVLILLPYMLKWLLGIETAFTYGGLYAITNTTFLFIACALTYLFVDPVIKAAYTLRCFHGLARHSGADLRAALKPFLEKLVVIGFILIAFGTYVPFTSSAADLSVSGKPSEQYVEQLDQHIEEVLQQRRFAWRMPREEVVRSDEDKKAGWLERSLEWLWGNIEAALKAMGNWMEALLDWLNRRLPAKENSRESGGDWRSVTRAVFYVIGAGLALILLFLIVRLWLNRPKDRLNSLPISTAPKIDINDENIAADDLPRDQWMTLARELMGRKEMRQALRALFLGVLSHLGDHDRVTIARYKSNRDYLNELARRAHAEQELYERFARCAAVFEQVWYGMYPVEEAQLNDFMTDQERIQALVQHPA